ncbi:MAG: alkaline phosphatase family protein [bacterium]
MKTTIVTACLSLTLMTCSHRELATEMRPRLIVVVVVDQMRADHLTRFASLFKYGFKRLLERGTVFENAYHDHARTETGPGHATIATGVFPSHHGIVANNWIEYANLEKVYCCEDTARPILGHPEAAKKSGRSPNRLLTSTFGDWLKAASPQSKVFGVARKDRAAILSTGRSADGAFWFDLDDGDMVTSTYYRQSYPAWVIAFNKARLVDSYFGHVWRHSASADAYRLVREDDCPQENDGVATTFPHTIAQTSGEPDSHYYKELIKTPFSDEMVLRFARSLVEHEQLGTDSAPDLLFVGCSAADAIGHAYGPFSHESLDYFLRLDKYLGDFFSYLDERIGAGRYLVVLSSDHGVLPIPETLTKQGLAAQRISSRALRAELTPRLAEVTQQLGVSANLVARILGPELYLNREALQNVQVSEPSLTTRLAEQLRGNGVVADVFTRQDLMGHTDGRPYLEAYRHSFHPQRSGDLVLRLQELCLRRTSPYGTSHGSPYDYDTHVPLVFMGAGLASGRKSARVRTVDIAPTLAEIIGVRATGTVDGRSLASNLAVLQKTD